MGLRAFWRREDGATALEFALVSPCLIILMLSIMEIGVLAFMSASLDNAVQSAARAVRTGQADGPATGPAFEDAICNRIMAASMTTCRDKLNISVRRFTSFNNVAAAAGTQPAGEFDRGQAGDIMLVKATLRWPLLTPFMGRLYHQVAPSEVILDSRATFKNEPYT